MRRALSLFFLVLGSFCYGQQKWSLHQCVNFALENNVSVKLADVQARLSKLTAHQTAQSLLPTLSGGANSSYQHGLNENPTTGTLQSANYISGSINVQSSYNIFSWNARRNNIEANRLLAKADEAAIDKARNDVALSIANAFLQVMLRREQIGISQLQMELSKSQLSNTQKLVQAGSLPELNQIQLQAQVAKDSAAVLQAQALAEQALINLKAYMNYDFSVPFDVETPAVETLKVDNITDLEPAYVYNLAVQNQPLQKEFQIRIKAAEKNIQAARGYMYPTLNAFAGLSTRAINAKTPVYGLLADQPTSSYVTINGSKVAVYAPTFGVVANSGTPFFSQLNRNFGQDIGLAINFSIFNGATSRTQWQRSKLSLLQLQAQNEQENVNLKSNIYSAYQDAFSSLQKYRASQRTVEYSQKALDISKKRYDIGLLGTLDYIITQNNLYLAQIDEVSSHYDYVFKMKVLEFYKGQGLKF